MSGAFASTRRRTSPPPRRLHTLLRCDALRRGVPYERLAENDEEAPPRSLRRPADIDHRDYPMRIDKLPSVPELAAASEQVAPSTSDLAVDHHNYQLKNEDKRGSPAPPKRRQQLPLAVTALLANEKKRPVVNVMQNGILLDTGAVPGVACDERPEIVFFQSLPISYETVCTTKRCRCKGFDEAPFRALLKFKGWDHPEPAIFTKIDDRLFVPVCEGVPRHCRTTGGLICVACLTAYRKLRVELKQFNKLRTKSVEERTRWLLCQANKNLTPKLRAEKERIRRYRRFLRYQSLLTANSAADGSNGTERSGDAGFVPGESEEADVTPDAIDQIKTDDCGIDAVEQRARQIGSMLDEGSAARSDPDLVRRVNELLIACRSIAKQNQSLMQTNQLLTADVAQLKAAGSAEEVTTTTETDVLLTSTASGGIGANVEVEVDELFFETVPDVSPTALEELQVARKEAARRERKRRPSGRPLPVPRPFTCELCLHRFKLERTLVYHRRDFHKIPLPREFLTCATCGKSFRRHYQLVRHVKFRHRETAREKTNQCPHCERRFVEKWNMLKHVKALHLKERAYVCDVCGKGFIEAQFLRYHKYGHTGERPFKCEYCERAYSHPDILRQHRKAIHEKGEPGDATQMERPFLCEQCGKTYRSTMGLRLHMKSHMPAQHKCDLCGRAFRTTLTLRFHRFRHTGERPFSCTLCEQTFRSPHVLDVHRRLEHSNEFTCEVCGKRLHSKLSLSDHLNTHTGNRPHVCQLCGDRFTSRSMLSVHRKNGCAQEQPRRGTKRGQRKKSRWRSELRADDS